VAGKPDKITGILLAGGKSSRMGREKGEIGIRGRSLLRTTLEILERSCDMVLISTCSDVPGLKGYRQVCDEIPGIGPMGGVYTCLRQSETELNLVFSYDMPMVIPALFEAMLAMGEDADLVVPALGEGLPEPLCAVYRKNVADSLQQLISQGNYAMYELFALVRTRILRVGPERLFYHPDLFLNVNRPTDLQRYRSILKKDGKY
jgi:molybdopterin-guanine dinucleotide biosynthesis protein A